MIAAALSFSTILSLIPLLAVSLAALQYIESLDGLYPKVESVVLEYFQGPIGEAGIKIVQKAFKRIHTGKLGPWGAAGLILASLMLISEMEKAIHRIWHLPERRPFYQRLFLFWIFLILFPSALLIFVGLTSMKIFGDANYSAQIPIFQNLILFLGLFLGYKFIPNTKVNNRAAGLGALVATLGLGILAKSFKWMSQSLFTWSKLYGSLAAIPALLVWILFIWYIVLLGVAITANFRRDSK